MAIARAVLSVLIGAGLCAAGGPERTPESVHATIEGLERLVGFERGCSSAALPAALNHRHPGTEAGETRDFEVPKLGQNAPRIVIRQVINREHLRITTQWWGVYANAERVDCWFFSPAGNDEHKLLAPYEIDQILSERPEAVVLRTYGEMHRPGGRGWMQRKDLVFSVSSEGLRLRYVLGRYFFSYEDVEGGSGVNLTTERAPANVADPRIEIRARTGIPAGDLAKCGFVHPLESEEGAADYRRRLDRAANCLDRQPGGRTCYRRLDEPSFVEHGGKPASCVAAP